MRITLLALITWQALFTIAAAQHLGASCRFAAWPIVNEHIHPLTKFESATVAAHEIGPFLQCSLADMQSALIYEGPDDVLFGFELPVAMQLIHPNTVNSGEYHVTVTPEAGGDPVFEFGSSGVIRGSGLLTSGRYIYSASVPAGETLTIDMTAQSVAAVPEPSSWAMFGLVGIGVAVYRWRVAR